MFVVIWDEDDMLFVYIFDFEDEDENDGDDVVSWIIVDFVE